MGHPLPPKTNPSDFFIDTITIDRRSPDQETESRVRIEKFSAAFQKLEPTLFTKVEKIPPPPPSESSLKRGGGGDLKWPSSLGGEFLILLERFMLNSSRDKMETFANMFQSIFLWGVMSFIYWQVGTDQASIQNILGFLFFLTLNLTFGVIMPSINSFPPVKRYLKTYSLKMIRIIKRERAAGTYRSLSAYLAKLVSTVPLLIMSISLLTIPSYFTVGLYMNAGAFFTYYCISIVNAFVAYCLGLMIGAAIPNVTVGILSLYSLVICVGQIVTPMIIIIYMLFGGLIINLNTIQVNTLSNYYSNETKCSLF